MIQVTAQVPDALYKQVEALAARENLSIDQLVAIALAAQVSAWSAKAYLEERSQRGSWEQVQQVLAQVPDVEPEAEDRL